MSASYSPSESKLSVISVIFIRIWLKRRVANFRRMDDTREESSWNCKVISGYRTLVLLLLFIQWFQNCFWKHATPFSTMTHSGWHAVKLVVVVVLEQN